MVAGNEPVAFVGGRIVTMDPWRPAAEVVVIERDRIAAVGDRELLRRYPTARVADLGGRSLLPGFIDAHNHLSIAALHPLWADLSGVRSMEELGRALAAQAEREAKARWVRGCGWNEAASGLILDGRDLDALGIDRPIIVAHYTLHQCVVSSQGLDELGIGRTTPDPPGGIIVRDSDGRPTGLLIERAWSEAHARSLAAYRDPERFAELFVARAHELLREGITCIHDAACSPAAEAIYRRLAAAGELPLSVLVMPHPEAILAPPAATRLEGPVTGEGDEWLRVGPLKLFADGGAAPALDVRVGGQRLIHGIRFADLGEELVRAVSLGFRVAVHAIGNAGLAAALDAFSRAARLCGDRDYRFRVEHAALASPAQLREMAALGAVGVVQPGFVVHLGQAVEGVEFDEERWLPFGDMVRAGIRIAASSDHPCAFSAPLLTSARGTTRRTGSGGIIGPEQALGYEEWLRAYTLGAAYAGGQEGERGSLERGKRADLVVVEGELDAENPPRVAETWVAGRLAYAAS